jgi:CBS domain-containing protein
MQVEDILRMKGTIVVTIDPEASTLELAQLLQQRHVGAAVVTDGHELLGVAAERDIVHAVAKLGPEALELPVSEIMSPAVVCEPRDAITDVMGAMTHRRVRHVPVLDSSGVMIGVVSLGDVVKHRLEEIETEANVLRDYITIQR